MLITGGLGFIGWHLFNRLTAIGHTATLIDNLRHPSQHIQLPLQWPHRFIQGDIRDPELIREVMQGIDTVFHLAAQSGVAESNKDPDYTFTTNVGGTVNVLTAASREGVQRLVFASTREVYGEPAVLPVSEQQQPNPKNTYGSSKVAAEAYCSTLGNSGGLTTVILRITDVYGEGDTVGLIPPLIEGACRNEDIVIHGGERLLDFVMVETVVDALIRAANPQVQPTVINIGSGQGVRMTDLAARILAVTGSQSRVVISPRREAEVVRFIADIRRMEGILEIVPPSDPLIGLEALAEACQRRMVNHY